MAFPRPTLTQLVARIEADLAAEFPSSSGIRRRMLRVIARVMAGVAYGLYAFIHWASRQIHPRTSDLEALREQAAFWGVAWRPRAKAHGSAVFSGTDASVIDAGTLLQRRSDGAEFTTDEEATIAAGTAIANVTAVEAGAAGNTAAGAELMLVSPIAGVSGTALAGEASISGGADDEKPERLLERLEQRVQNPPEGGADHDYERWALERPGVTRVWVYRRWLGAGTVGVTFVYDDRDDIIPTAQDVLDMQAYLEAPSRGPATADIIAFAPTPVPLNPDISLTPDTTDTRAAVVAELKDFLYRDARPGGVLRLSRFDEAISIAAGEDHHVLNSPVADIVSEPGQMPVLGVPSWGA
jgi:uncharacterized phage protein gp47/JayE